MIRGHKQRAENIFLDIQTRVRKIFGFVDQIALYYRILFQLKPVFRLIAKRIGRQTFEIPLPLYHYNSTKIGLKWFLEAVDEKNKQTRAVIKIRERIVQEFVSVITDGKQSDTIKKRNNFFERVAVNRTYSHYRWK